MAGSKRQRSLARAKHERQAARRGVAAARRKRRQQIVAAVVVVALVLGSVAWVVLSRPTGDDAAADLAAELVPTASADPGQPSPSPLASGSADVTARLARTGLSCSPPGTPRADNITYGSPATTQTTATSITLTTNCGPIVIDLDTAAPKTIASEVFLAGSGFYDNTSCHRLVTDGIFVLQCGDPAGDGSGGPGYVVDDENLPAAGADGLATYPAGTVAMANAGPGTGGSQFFIVYRDSPLPPDYTVWGTVSTGLDVVEKAARAGTVDGGSDGTPLQPVFIESASVQGA